MDIWQGVTTIVTGTWGTSSNVQVVANANNTYELVWAANALPSTTYPAITPVHAGFDVFGNMLPAGVVPFTTPTAFGPVPFDELGYNVDMERLSNGNWLIAYHDETPIGTANWLAEFDSNFGLIGLSNFGGLPTPSSPLGYEVEIIQQPNGYYTLGIIIGNNVFAATSQVGASLPNTVSVLPVVSNYPNIDGLALSPFESNGATRVFWVDIQNLQYRLMTAVINAAGQIIIGPSAFATTTDLTPIIGLEVLRTADSVYVLWTEDGGITDPSDLKLSIQSSTSASVISIPALVGTPSTSIVAQQIMELKNGNIAILYKILEGSTVQSKILIINSTGGLIENFTLGTAVGYDHMAELTDGRIVVANAGQYIGVNYELQQIIVDPRPDTIYGTAGDDNITGKTNKAETIFAGEGADTLYTMSGGGTLFGEGGGDTLFGGNGFDFIYGGTGLDALYGDQGSDELDGGDDIDDLFGGAGTDYLYGGNGSDDLYGGADMDLLFGDQGSDGLYGGTEQDTVTYINSTSGISLEIGGTTNTGDAAGDTFDSIERFVLTNQNDIFKFGTGTAVIDVNGAGGDDQLWSKTAGFSTMLGGAGKDVFVLQGGNSTIRGDDEGGPQSLDIAFLFFSIIGVNVNMAPATTRNATFTFLFNGQTQTAYGDVDGIAGSVFNDTIQGNGFDNYFLGSLGNDTFYGFGGNDEIYGEEGADTLIGGTGTNRLYGGDDVDTFFGGSGTDYIYGESGLDILYYSSSAAGVTVNLVSNVNTGGDAQGDFIYGMERVSGSAQNDSVTGDAQNNVFYGQAGNDSLFGGAGEDTLFGGNGDDSLVGGPGTNTLYGGNDTDSFFSGNGIDRIYGEAGTLDIAYYTNSTAAVTINLSTNTNTGGDAAGDLIYGVERVSGTNLGDSITGDIALNYLYGLAGADTINGGLGVDILYGGADSDTFRFTETNFGADVVVDFTDTGAATDDRLSFALSVADSFSDFTFVGNGTTSVTVTIIGGQTFTVRGPAAITLDASDFVFA